MCNIDKNVTEHTKLKPSRTATLNVWKNGEKISELISFTEKTNVDILVMAEIMRKDGNMQEVFKKYFLIWSWVAVN